MKINDIEKITGLSKKAIRLYEEKGLVCVSRDENGYRNYSNDDAERLKEIKLLRSIGAPISDIKLYFCGVMSLDELMDKRKAEILNESGKNSEKYRICESIQENITLDNLNVEDFNETENVSNKVYKELCVGIDIGTTTVSAVVYDVDGKEQVEAYSVPHNSYVYSDIFSEQSVSAIMEKSEKLLYHILNTYDGIISIGISGQMHGIAYIDKDLRPISNLINWQDKRADQALDGKKSACEKIFELTGEKIHTGYGIATHYYNMLNGNVPKDATFILSIMDIFAVKICGLNKPIIHSSIASSLGLFDLEKGEFMKDKLSLLGFDESLLPPVTGESVIIGECKGIPVSIPIGDNQASFLGSVSNNNDTVLINIGTGSQVSAVSDYCRTRDEIELRPFIEGKYLICASALCGGYAYSMLESFFRSYAVSLGIEEASQYKIIYQLATQAYENGEDGLLVDTSFLGKRSVPEARGSIKMIDRQNFTPSNLVIGMLKGMCNELYELYELFPKKFKNAMASGGTVKRNPVLKLLLAERFGMPVSNETVKEEAGTGVALFSALAIKKIKYKNGFGQYLKGE